MVVGFVDKNHRSVSPRRVTRVLPVWDIYSTWHRHQTDLRLLVSRPKDTNFQIPSHMPCARRVGQSYPVFTKRLVRLPACGSNPIPLGRAPIKPLKHRAIPHHIAIPVWNMVISDTQLRECRTKWTHWPRNLCKNTFLKYNIYQKRVTSETAFS